MKKVIFIDIDGTLLDCLNGVDKITNPVKQSIKNFQELGNYVFIASGRSYAFLNDDILNFGFDGYLLVNGANVLLNNNLIYSKSIDKIDLNKFITDFEKLNIQYSLQGKKYTYMKDEYKNLYSYYKSYGISKKYIKNTYDLQNIDIYKIDILCKNKESINYAHNLENNKYLCYHDNNYQKENVEIFSFNLRSESKGNTVKKVMNHLNINIKNSFAFGDERNDIEMLQSVGCGIAMGNASNVVKKHANKVTETVINDGVAKGIENYIL